MPRCMPPVVPHIVAHNDIMRLGAHLPVMTDDDDDTCHNARIPSRTHNDSTYHRWSCDDIVKHDVSRSRCTDLVGRPMSILFFVHSLS